MGFLVFIFLGALAFIIFFSVKFIKGINEEIGNMHLFFYLTYILTFFLFGYGLSEHSFNYFIPIDPLDACYTPFAYHSIATMYCYFILFNISLFLLFLFGKKLPPLFLFLLLMILFIGIPIDVVVLIQVCGHDVSSLGDYGCSGSLAFFFTPLLALILAINQIVIIVRTEIDIAQTRHFKNQFLERCNQFLSKRYNVTVWALIFMLPLFLIITLILVLFGQDANSLVKVLTDTTTWTFSQKSHPPILTHNGHYLCTVAAKGDPKIVKPIRLGKRHGNTIIVNRQLQIANAFEELLSDYAPKLHRFIRKNYDKYGYNLSLKINSLKGSNTTYIIMKPLEWFFLVCLYLFCQKPEQKISKQYSSY